MPRNVDRDERRREVARAAIQLLAKRGPRGLTLRALADELGGSITLVTHFYPNRRALLDAVTEQVIEDSATELAALDNEHLAPDERLRQFLTWLLPTTPDALALERGRVMLAAEPDTHFNVQNFYDTWESKTRALIERYLTGLVPAEEKDFYVDLLRVVGNGVVLSAVEHPKTWTEDKQRAFIDGVIRLLRPRVGTGTGEV
jgi:AcrR family transcriptional regulator